MPDKRPKTTESVAASKQPRTTETAESFYSKNPAWRFSKADFGHPEWSVLDSHKDVVEDPNDPTGTALLHKFSRSIDKVLLDALKDRENMTWGAIATQTGGPAKGTNNHSILIKDLIPEARARATELGIIEDELYSLRFGGKPRAWGILRDGVLEVIWFDREHKICPSQKRNT